MARTITFDGAIQHHETVCKYICDLQSALEMMRPVQLAEVGLTRADLVAVYQTFLVLDEIRIYLAAGKG